MAISVSGNTDIGTDPWIPFNSIQFNFIYIAPKQYNCLKALCRAQSLNPPGAQRQNTHTHTHTHHPVFISFLQTVNFSVSLLPTQIRTDRHTHTHTHTHSHTHTHTHTHLH